MNATISPLLREPFSVYREKSAEYLTSHQLAAFRRCPLLYRQRQLGLIADEDRPAYLVGRALHTLVLEGREAFEQEYAVGGPVNPRTGEPFGASTKAFAEWAAAQGRPVLTEQQRDLIESLAASVSQHGLARDLLSSGTAEGVVRAEYCGVPCQARPDWFDPSRGLVDLKTCEDLDWFEADARRYGYVNQVAFYRAVLGQVLEEPKLVRLIAVEKKEPYRCGVWQVSDAALSQARRENEAAIWRLRWCQVTETWPTGYEELRTLD